MASPISNRKRTARAGLRTPASAWSGILRSDFRLALMAILPCFHLPGAVADTPTLHQLRLIIQFKSAFL